MSREAAGTLNRPRLLPGEHLYLLGTGTGLAPFLSIVKDPESCHRFDKIVLVHAFGGSTSPRIARLSTEELPANEYFGENVRDRLIYYPTVAREKFRNPGRGAAGEYAIERTFVER